MDPLQLQLVGGSLLFAARTVRLQTCSLTDCLIAVQTRLRRLNHALSDVQTFAEGVFDEGLVILQALIAVMSLVFAFPASASGRAEHGGSTTVRAPTDEKMENACVGRTHSMIDGSEAMICSIILLPHSILVFSIA